VNCQTTQYLIQEYLEDELNTTKRLELSQHLLECAACREEMNQMEQADAYFSTQPLLSPPESLLESIMAEISFTQPDVQAPGLVRNTPKRLIHRLWYIPLSLGQFILAVSVLIAIRPEWLLSATWANFLKRISAIGWDLLLFLKNAGMRLYKLLYLNKVSFGDGIYGFLVQSSWIKLSLFFILLILTFYLNGRLLFAQGHIPKKV